MEIRVCPKCSRAFYAHSDGESVSCPGCGYFLLDRRYNERVGKELDFTFLLNGERRMARLKDYSGTGIRMSYGGAALALDAAMDIEIGEINMRGAGKAVWTVGREGSLFSSGVVFIRKTRSA
jgi:hypothetical protein